MENAPVTLGRRPFLDLFTDEEVKSAVEGLPDTFKLPVILADVEGFAHKEIAEMLDIPVGTVMSRLHREESDAKELYEYAKARGLSTTVGIPTDGRLKRDAGRTRAEYRRRVVC